MKTIGIDLGTSNSAAAVMQSGRPVIIPSAEGAGVASGKAFPSYVAFTKDGQRLVGEPARRQAVINPEGTIQAVKRKMGTSYRYKIFGKEYIPQEISAFILQKIKQDAEAYLGDKVEEAVITCPAYFDDNQRTATKNAGEIAGLKVLRIINEPTAACLAYGLEKTGKELKILVFDFGGGTLDVTIMEMWKEGGFKVMATSGDTQLGGTDMDNVLIDYIANQFKKESGIDLRNDKMAMQRLREGAEKAKVELSSTLTTDINLPFITADSTGPKHLTMSITRAKLEELISPIIEKCREPLKQALKDAKKAFAKQGVKAGDKDVDKIIMVGGPTRMPIVQKFVEDYFGKKIERGVDPMECVAMGAAIQAAIIKGEVREILLLDVTPLTLGVETLGSVSTPLIPRNTTIPTSKSEIFSTAADSQTQVEINVLQGERPLARDNKSLGRFILNGIPPAPRGIPQIEVAFDIDANGILTVSAKDKATGKAQSIKITGSTGLTKDEIEKMKEEAEKHAEEDKAEREKIEAKNKADGMIYTAEKSVKEAGDKVPKDIKEEIEKKIKELKEILNKGTKEELEEKTKELSEVLQKIGQYMYKNQKTEDRSQKREAKKDGESKKNNKKEVEEGEVVN
jgi:molecular chaperone DnaK